MPPANKLDMSKGPPLFLGISAAGPPPPPLGRAGPADVGEDFFPVMRMKDVTKCLTKGAVVNKIINHFL